jgi:voltage-gated sodium channel
MPTLRQKIGTLVEAPWFTGFIAGVIILNAIGLGLETSPAIMERWGGIILFYDRLALGIYCVEIFLKLVAWRWAFFRSGWNWFDFIIVTVALLPASGTFAVLRALRVLRVLRLFSVVPRLRSVVDALLTALPGMGSVVVVMGLVFYVAAVMATKIFASAFPDWFGSVPRSAYSLFQVMTLESWSMGIVRPVMEVYPYAWVFFVPFIIVTSFTVLNLFIALLVSSMQTQHDAERERESADIKEAAHLDAVALRREIQELRTLLEQRLPPENPTTQRER